MFCIVCIYLAPIYQDYKGFEEDFIDLYLERDGGREKH